MGVEDLESDDEEDYALDGEDRKIDEEGTFRTLQQHCKRCRLAPVHPYIYMM